MPSRKNSTNPLKPNKNIKTSTVAKLDTSSDGMSSIGTTSNNSQLLTSSEATGLHGVIELSSKLRAEWNKGEKVRNMGLIKNYLEEGKLKFIASNSEESTEGKVSVQQQEAIRDILEIGLMYSVFKFEPDIQMFERYMAQLKVYYVYHSENISTSQHQFEILGANLLCLLTENRLAEFHMELERICYPPENSAMILDDPFIKRAMELERALEEGNYLHIQIQDGPQRKSGLWRYFVDKLIKSSRLSIAATLESAYATLTINTAVECLKLRSANELNYFAKQRNWKIREDGVIRFQQKENENFPAASIRIIKETLSYAKGIDGII